MSAEDMIAASLVLRHAAGNADVGERLLAGTFEPRSRDEAAAQTAADPADIASVESFAKEHGFKVLETNAATRTIKVGGSAEGFERAFGISIHESQGVRSYQGEIKLPDTLRKIVVAVLGLDTKPVARPRNEA